MKTNILTTIFLIMGLLLVGCDNSVVPPTGGNDDCGTETTNPNENFTKFSLENTSCEWKGCVWEDRFFGNPFDSAIVVIINSVEKLKLYITCAGDEDFPEIDFSKYSLLLVSGVQPYMVHPSVTAFQQISTQNYLLEINLQPTLAPVITHWHLPIIVSKMSDDSVVELVVTAEEERQIGNVPFKSCSCEKEIIRKFSSEAYLFRNSISEQMADYISNKMYSEPFPVVSWIVFYTERDEAVINIGNLFYPNGGHILSVGQICNFPDFAKEWSISENGIKVDFDGIMREPCNPSGSQHVVHFDFTLTTLTRR